MSSATPNPLAWTALLGRWIEFAQASLAIPTDADGGRWRQVVPAVINLQAVTFALADLEALPCADRPYARDRAAVLIAESVVRLDEAWRGHALPASLAEIAADARASHAASVYAGAVELVWASSSGAGGVDVMPTVDVTGTKGTLAVMAPGTLVMPGEPVAWWVDRDGDAMITAVPRATQRRPRVPHQVYRAIDTDGRIVRDVVLPVTAEPAPGLPLLVPLFLEGRPIGRFTMDPEGWERRQRAGLVGDAIRVEDRTGEEG